MVKFIPGSYVQDSICGQERLGIDLAGPFGAIPWPELNYGNMTDVHRMRFSPSGSIRYKLGPRFDNNEMGNLIATRQRDMRGVPHRQTQTLRGQDREPFRI